MERKKSTVEDMDKERERGREGGAGECSVPFRCIVFRSKCLYYLLCVILMCNTRPLLLSTPPGDPSLPLPSPASPYLSTPSSLPHPQFISLLPLSPASLYLLPPSCLPLQPPYLSVPLPSPPSLPQHPLISLSLPYPSLTASLSLCSSPFFPFSPQHPFTYLSFLPFLPLQSPTSLLPFPCNPLLSPLSFPSPYPCLPTLNTSSLSYPYLTLPDPTC